MARLAQENLHHMKLRVLNNSVRLRLTRTEVNEAASSGIVSGSVVFPDGAVFNYVFESSPSSVTTCASFAGGELTIRMPQSDVRSGAESERVSIVAEQALENGQTLEILVEKDFACLAPREGEDETDMYPHPQAGQEVC
jgi:hypothetical protein